MSLLICLACAVLAMSNLARFLATGKWLYPLWVSGAVVAVAFLGLLAGCAPRVEAGATRPEIHPACTRYSTPVGASDLFYCVLPDNTRCVMAGTQGGLVCEFSPRPGVPGNFRVE